MLLLKNVADIYRWEIQDSGARVRNAGLTNQNTCRYAKVTY
jgi:hypothetical protein